MMLAAAAASAAAQNAPGVTKFVRFRANNRVAHGVLEGDTIREISGDLFGRWSQTNTRHQLSQVKLLYPVQPGKVLALAGNYKSHTGDRTPVSHPEIFYKPVSCLQNPGDPIVIPKDATDLHFECELVLVIGKRASRLSVAQAKDAIFGVTCGNDVSERQWQNGPKKDTQWWRAKGSDTFGPLGPAIARGLDFSNLEIQTRLNGKVMQKDSTSALVHDGPTTVSFISHYVTLEPGDIIYTGTPGKTSPMKSGDVVEVEIEGVGILKNPLAAA